MSAAAMGWGPTQRTLLIPLAGRAIASRLYPQFGFEDPIAEDLAKRLPFDLSGFMKDRSIVLGTLLRTRIFDDLIADFLSRTPNSVVLNLGAGFCTRAWRLRPVASWIEVDAPEVLAEKRKLFPASRLNVHFIEGDLNNSALFDGLVKHADAPVLVVAEGLLMFLPRSSARSLLSSFDAFAAQNSRFLFDFVHPLMPMLSLLNPSLRRTKARYQWGTCAARECTAGLERTHLRSASHFSRGAAGTRLGYASQVAKIFLGATPYDIADLIVDEATRGP